VQWPVSRNGGAARLFEDGRFATADGRARMLPVRPAGPAEPVDGAFPLALNTGRVRDHWHTLTRTGLIPELSRHEPEPFVEVHPEDAAAAGVRDGALARVITGQGAAVARARVTDGQRPGSLFMPMHWSVAFAPSGRANVLTGQARDAISGQPEFKHAPARIRPYGETWSGFLLARRPWACPPGLDLVWRRATLDHCVWHQFAGRGDGGERTALHKALRRGAGKDVLALEDEATGLLREAFLDPDGRLERVLFMTAGRLPSPHWLAELFGEGPLAPAQRGLLLYGTAPGRSAPASPTVCACMGVDAARIQAAVGQGARDEAAVQKLTQAGANCGSCRPEIRRLVREAIEKEPAYAA
jgi:assimilatory nitrate reductase catalytic subunit